MKKLTDILLELADSSKPFPFKEEGEKHGTYTYSFSTDQHDYIVEVETTLHPWNKENPFSMHVSFETKKSSYLPTDEGLPTALRVMSTVQAIVEDVANTVGQRPSKISFFASTATLKGVGRFDKVANQRASLYLRYIQNKYPNGKVTREGNRVSVMLREQPQSSVSLKEIADSAPPFEFEQEQFRAMWGTMVMARYSFRTKSHKYLVTVDMLREPDWDVNVAFRTTDLGYGTTDEGLGTSLRVMSTVREIVRAAVQQANIQPHSISFYPSIAKTSEKSKGDGGNQRKKLYLAYIKKAYPHSTVTYSHNDIVVKLNPQDA